MKYIVLLIMSFLFTNNQSTDIIFSINGVINSKYKEPDKFVGLNCSIFEDSKLIGSDTITNIKTKFFELIGELTLASLKNTKIRIFKSNTSLLIFYDHKVNLKDSIKLNWEKNLTANNNIINFLLNDKSTLIKQGYVFHKIDTTLSDKSLIKYMNNRYDIKSTNIENSDLLIIYGDDKFEKRNDSFTAIMIKNDINFIAHSKFKQIIKIDSNYYILLIEFVPSTGIHSYTIYTIKKNKLIKIFCESSFST